MKAYKLIYSFLVIAVAMWSEQNAYAQDSTGTQSILLVQNQKQPRTLVLDKIIAKVDNHIVLKSELDVAYLQSVASGQKANKDLKCEVLQSLIINKMLMAKADIDSISIDEKTVEDQLERRMQYFISQIGSEKKLEEYYNKSILQLKSDMRGSVKEQMLIQKMQDHITAKVKVTPGEVKAFFNDIPKDSLPYFSTEVQVGQIVKLPTVSKNQKEVARQKLLDIRTQILENGANFGEMAKRYSEDYGSARFGGDLGYMNKGDLVPEYEAASLKMKAGDISMPVESQFGFHLIQLIDRRGSQFSTRHILIKPSSSQNDVGEAMNFLDSLATKILQDSISFEKAAKDYSDDKMSGEQGGMFKDTETGSTFVPLEKLDPVIFFIIDTMKVGNITKPQPFRMADNKEAVRIIYYKSKVLPHQANLKDDYQKIYNATIAEKKDEVLQSWFEKTHGEVFIDIDPEFKNCKILQE